MPRAKAKTAETVERFPIKNRFTGEVIFTAELTCSPDTLPSIKLARANLARAYLADANLAGANLAGANLAGANLARAKNLNEEALRSFKADLFLTLDALHAGPLEALHLIAKLNAGEVDGSSYGDKGVTCACLVGTIAQPRGVRGDKLDHNNDRPAERWFMMINPGDKPGAVDSDGKPTGGGYAAQKALEWVRDWCVCHGVDPDAPVPQITELAA